MSTKDHWDVSAFNTSPIIKQLKPFTDNFKHHTQWPTIENYAHVFDHYQLNVRPVPQALSVNAFEEQYEPRVYLKNELQTRTGNWHDFFNAMIWLKFPKTKTTLNKLHYSEAKMRKKGSNRTTLENRITQFDECGAIIICSNSAILDLIRNHQWYELFINQREEFENNISCIVLGHAIFEKALAPYIGMTCHCILIENKGLLEQVKSEHIHNLDQIISNLWLEKISVKPEKLSAFPILGIPGLWPEQDSIFYSNPKYFR